MGLISRNVVYALRSRSLQARSKSLTRFWYASQPRDLNPCLTAFIADTRLPPSVLGPVDLSQGLQRLIASACRARRSGVQPFAMLMVRSVVATLVATVLGLLQTTVRAQVRTVWSLSVRKVVRTVST